MEIEVEKRKPLILGFFRQHPLAVVSTVSQEGVPNSSCVYQWIDEDLTTYFVTTDQTRKINNIQAGSKVSVLAYDENVLISSQIHGIAELLSADGENEKITNEIRNIIVSRKSGYFAPPIEQLPGEKYVLVKVKPLAANFANYSASSDSEVPATFELSL